MFSFFVRTCHCSLTYVNIYLYTEYKVIHALYNLYKLMKRFIWYYLTLFLLCINHFSKKNRTIVVISYLYLTFVTEFIFNSLYIISTQIISGILFRCVAFFLILFIYSFLFFFFSLICNKYNVMYVPFFLLK